MKNSVIIISLLISMKVISQDYNEITRNFIGTFHTRNTTINGISIGAFPFNDTPRFVRTNGLRLEIPGIGFLGFMASGSIIREGTEEIVNGFNISSGTLSNISYNGVTLGFVQCGTENNGLALAGWRNGMNISNGVQISGVANEVNYSNGLQISGIFNGAKYMKGVQIAITNDVTERMVGIQIGLVNYSKDTRGIQIGLWNCNEKRQLPIINWNFKRKKNINSNGKTISPK